MKLKIECRYFAYLYFVIALLIAYFVIHWTDQWNDMRLIKFYTYPSILLIVPSLTILCGLLLTPLIYHHSAVNEVDVITLIRRYILISWILIYIAPMFIVTAPALFIPMIALIPYVGMIFFSLITEAWQFIPFYIAAVYFGGKITMIILKRVYLGIDKN